MVHLLAAVAHEDGPLSRGLRAALAAAALLLPAAASAGEVVLVARYSGVINPPAAEFLQSAVAEAGARKANALVIQLDTPGGLDLSMRDIVKATLASDVPVVVHVWPSGARAASAGVFITMAAHVAAMTPGTNIGAAHPVQLGGSPGKKEGEKKDEVMEAKVANDMVAYLQAIAGRRGRNVGWALEVVSKSTSIASGEAVRLKVVDLEADSLEKLLEKIHGRALPDFPGRPLKTAGVPVERLEMSARQRFLAAIADPNIAMILMTLGVSGILIELYSPGLILPGIVGAVSLILAFYSFQTLSASMAGVALILVGFILFLLELKITSYGLLGLTGTAALILGALMLFRHEAGGLRVGGGVLFGLAATALLFLLAVLTVFAQAVRRRSPMGPEGMAGQVGTAETPLEPRGTVLVAGELWRAVSAEGAVPAGAEVVVVSVDGMTLTVKRRGA